MSKAKVLIVAFESGNLADLGHLLASNGYEVEKFLVEDEVNARHDIVEHVKTTKPDLIIVDVPTQRLPSERAQSQGKVSIKLDGVESLRETLCIPVAYISATKPKGWIDYYVEYSIGPVRLVAKPFEMSQIESAITDAEDRSDIDRRVREFKDKRQETESRQIAGPSPRKREEHEWKRFLFQREDFYASVLEWSPEIVSIKDEYLEYVYVNQAMVDLLGRKESAIIGLTDMDLFEGEAAQLLETDILTLKGQRMVGGRVVKRVNGLDLVFDERTIPLRNSDGKIIGVLSFSNNITPTWVERNSVGTSQDYPSHAMRSCLEQALLAAKNNSTVLLLGESGSGKDFLARYIHDNSSRRSKPYFSLNCAAIPTEMAESELFGHEKGSFTGAHQGKKGLVEFAEGGTLLLNEIGELQSRIQAKLFTFLDTKSFVRVGGQKSVRVDVRIIAATHRDLDEEVAEGRFLEPLFYRLNVFSIWVPPLRERLEDLPIVVFDLLVKLAKEMKISSVPAIEGGAIEVLQGYTWPGNVRELQNVLERAIVFSGNSEIAASAISEAMKSQTNPKSKRLHGSRITQLVTVSQNVSSCQGQRVLRPVIELTDDEFRILYEETCVGSDEDRGLRGATEAIAAVLGCERETVSRRLSKLSLPKVRKGRPPKGAMKQMLRQLESWLARQGFECGPTPR